MPDTPFPAKTFTHVIMTRFNLATPGREFTLRTQPGWLKERFEIFERVCLPSVAAQTVKDFHWIIYFDIDTPAEFKARIARLQEQVPFTAYYTPLFPAEGWRESLRQTYALDAPLLLTTRLDNDDALASAFVDRIQRSVQDNGCQPGSYNFTNGIIRKGAALYAIRHPANAFFSWLEPVAPEFRTAPSIVHMVIANHGPVFQIGGPPAWMQVVHETNVSNKVRGQRVSERAVEGLFCAEATEGLQDAGFLPRLAEAAVLYPLRSLRDRVRALF